jgi:predicted deacylase
MYIKVFEKEKNRWEKENEVEESGYNLLVIGGTHGNESNAVKLVQKFIEYLTAAFHNKWDNYKKITIVNALNTEGLKYNEREYNQAEKEETNDLNRFFNKAECPSKEEIMEELEALMKDADVVVDVHNSANILPCISVSLNENADSYINWAIKNNFNFILADDNPTIKRHADIDLKKVAFTYEFSGMGFDVRVPGDVLTSDLEYFKNFLKCIPKDIGDTDVIFHQEGEYADPVEGEERKYLHKHSFWKACPNFNIPGNIVIFNYKYITMATHKDGLYHWIRENPLGNYKKGEQIAFIEDPIDKYIVEEIRAPDDGTLICIDDSWWACEGGSLGEFQPRLPEAAYHFYTKDGLPIAEEVVEEKVEEAN